MKTISRQLLFGAGLIALSVAVYLLHYAIFGDARNIFYYMIMDIAFMFIQVLIVTVILNELLVMREKKAMLQKLNMVIGAFFSEVGTELLKNLSKFQPEPGPLSKGLMVDGNWPDEKFLSARAALKQIDIKMDAGLGDLNVLRDMLVGERGFLLGLLENQNLLEHASFTDLLWAVFHLTEELSSRNGFEGLPAADLDHLSGDIKRAYVLLVSEWVAYMNHLKNNYPYLFSLAVRKNPFNPDASPVISK